MKYSSASYKIVQTVAKVHMEIYKDKLVYRMNNRPVGFSNCKDVTVIYTCINNIQNEKAAVILYVQYNMSTLKR